jgi:hypothetical protein
VELFFRERERSDAGEERERGKRRGEFDQEGRAFWLYAYHHRWLQFGFPYL